MIDQETGAILVGRVKHVGHASRKDGRSSACNNSNEIKPLAFATGFIILGASTLMRWARMHTCASGGHSNLKKANEEFF